MPDRPPRYRPPRPTCHRPPDARPSAARRGYGRDWQSASKAFLDEHPLCVRCQARGFDVSATVVDHVTPHKGDQVLFWDEANWQALCKPCHDTKTATEDGGFGRTPKPTQEPTG